MLKISFIHSSGPAVTLQLEGQVTGLWVRELSRSCECILAEGEGLILDLAQVSFLDPNGIALIRSLAERQVSLRNASPFVSEQLRGDFHDA